MTRGPKRGGFHTRVDAVREDLYPGRRTYVRQRHGGDLMLTSRQQEIWQYLAEYVDDHGYPPTVREIGDAVGLAPPSTVHAPLANLERAGLLRRDPTKPRAIELIGRRKSELAHGARDSTTPVLPLVGPIAAARPLLPEGAI